MRVVTADLEDPRHQAEILEILDEYAREPGVPSSGLSEYVRTNLMAKLREHPTTVVLLAEAEDRFVGVSVCFLGFSTFYAKPLLNVHDFAVRAEWRGRGVGKALMQASESKARELDCCKMTLEVAADNERAFGLYRSVGFDQSRPNGADGGELLYLEKRFTA